MKLRNVVARIFRRRRIQFRLRTLLVLTFVITILLAPCGRSWWKRMIVRSIQQDGGDVVFAEVHDDKVAPYVGIKPGSHWRRALAAVYGNELFDDVVTVAYHAPGFNNESLKSQMTALKQLAELRIVHLDGTRVTDDGLHQLQQLPSLRFVSLRNTSVSEAAIEEFRSAIPDCRVIR